MANLTLPNAPSQFAMKERPKYAGNQTIFAFPINEDKRWGFSKKLLAAVVAFNAAVVKFQADVEALLNDREKYEASDPIEQLNFAAVAPQLRMREIELLQREVKLRDAWTEIDQERRAAATAASQQAGQDIQRLRDDVRRRFVSIGFSDTATAGQRGWIPPGHILSHPLIREQEEFAAAIHQRNNERSQCQANDAARKRSHEILTALAKAATRI